MFARFIGAGYLFYFLLLVADVRSLTAVMAGWWTPLALVLFFGPGLALGVASFAFSGPRLRLLANLTAVTYPLGLMTWPLAWSGTLLPNGKGVWFSTFPALSSLAAGAVWRARWAFVQLAVVMLGAQLINYTVRTPDVRSPFVPDIAFGIGVSLLFVGAAVVAARTGQVHDATRADTFAAAASAASLQARTVERQRFDALTHDSVMSTLLAASRIPLNEGLIRQADIALTQLDGLRVGVLPTQDFDPPAVLSHLRAAASEVDESISLAVHRSPGSEHTLIPAETVRTIGAALAEALRNSLRHAGAGAHRNVIVALGPGRLSVIVSDTGKGFDISSVPAHRLGLAVSILDRMNHLPGGSATVESRPKIGTRIELTWAGSEQ
ncbi:sensor histidine kinase [Rhodococcus sp. T7]|uniref:sensor histidine kinase n=2 Tax=Rhodococcus sp. T7 TaxID=627444 RepID=UPI0013594CD0|nr:ATP-binding protein [Rhodococcus sp. T7]